MILRRKPLGTDAPTFKSQSKLKKRRALRHELLEERRLLAVGPQLLGIDHNNGVLIQEGSIINTAPRELTFRFDEGQVLDRATLNAIRLVRSGGDGVFDNGNDVTINPGYLDLGQSSFSVVMRFNQTLVDDMYRVQIIGQGTGALRNTAWPWVTGPTTVSTTDKIFRRPSICNWVRRSSPWYRNLSRAMRALEY